MIDRRPVDAVHIASVYPGIIPEQKVRKVQIELFDYFIANERPLDAHRLAVRFKLGTSFEQRASDIAFEQAIEQKNYTLGRTSDGETIMILR